MRPLNRTATGRIVMRPRRLGNTRIGANVIVAPVDPGTGCSPVTVRFDEVLATGITSVVSSNSGPPPPDGFLIQREYYELVTTATFRTAELCFRDDAGVAPAIARLESGRWEILATTRARNGEVRARVACLSQFALLEPVAGALGRPRAA